MSIPGLYASPFPIVSYPPPKPKAKSKAGGSNSSSSGHPSHSHSRRSHDETPDPMPNASPSANAGTSSKNEIPYPLSLDREFQQLWIMDRQIIMGVRGKLDYVDWNGKYPRRCLDLCCGLGDWVVDTARRWPDTTFVGFDISREQISRKYLEPSIAERISWVHGNVLEKLPFEDCEFDFVHIFSMGLCIPEDKVHSLYLEIARIMKPGGIVQEMDEDAIFPVLPRWFTAPLHAMGSTRAEDPPPSPMTAIEEPLPHDHFLLETLFYSTFENKFISTKPSSVFPGYFSSVFTQVRSPPVLNFYMPPLAPLPPFNRENIPQATYFHRPTRRIAIPQLPPAPSNTTNPAVDHQRTFVPPSSVRRPPNPLSPLSPLSLPLPPSSVSSPILPPEPSTFPRSDSMSSLPSSENHTSILTSIGTITGAECSTTSLTTSDTTASTGSLNGLNTGSDTFAGYGSGGETTHIGVPEEAYSMVKMDKVLSHDHHSLYVHLYHMVQMVRACKERMWEQLKEMALRRDESLRTFGWEKEEDWSEAASKKKFKWLWDRFEYDTHERIAMWHSLVHYGWTYPRQNAMSESEIQEQEELRRTILAARAIAREGEDETESRKPMRQIRLMVGVKPKDP